MAKQNNQPADKNRCTPGRSCPNCSGAEPLFPGIAGEASPGPLQHDHRDFLVALAGQPNCGKSSVFNMLTGSRQHVANFPGVTVEKKQGRFRFCKGGNSHELVDLPGTYSLTSFTTEERIARDFILLERPEVVVAVVDASNLKRNLYLVFQLREMGVPMVVCLNMMDVAERRGIHIDADRLADALGVPVVPTVASRGKGREALREAIHRVAVSASHTPHPMRLDYGADLEAVLAEVEGSIREHEHLTADFPTRWLAVRFMEGDAEADRILLHHTHDAQGHSLRAHVEGLRAAFAERNPQAPEKVIANARHQQAGTIFQAATRQRRTSPRTVSDRVDTVLLHPRWGPVLLAVVLVLFYQVTIGAGGWLAERMAPALEAVSTAAGNLFARPDALREGVLSSLITDGVLAGVLTMLYYVPLFFVLFLCIGLLEDSGYMARIAVLMDRALRRFGMHGQSTLPLLLGGVVVGGCAVPGILATRAMRDEKARRVTILIVPLLNCMAKIPVYILVVGTFIPAESGFALLPGLRLGYQGLAMFGVSVFGFLVALGVARLFSRWLVPGETTPFVMELPSYHLPTASALLRRVWSRLWEFLRKVMTVVVLALVVVWFLVRFPGIGPAGEMRFDRDVQAVAASAVETMGEGNPYAYLAEPANLPAVMAFADRYEDAVEQAGDDEAALADLQADFARRNGELLAVITAEAGVDAPSAVGANRALAELRTSVQHLRSQRRQEIVQNSYASSIGRLLEPISQWAGFDWRMNVATISGIAAKENVVGTLRTLYAVEETGTRQLGKALRAAGGGWDVRHSLAVLAFVALFPPCVPTLAVIRSELRSTRWALFAAIYPVILGFGLAVLVFQLGGLLMG